MLSTRVLLVALAAITLASCYPSGEGMEGDEEVRLVVMMSLDQLPVYLFERYDSLYSGGLRRLLDEGRSYTRAAHDHALTLTSPGHATLTTGLTPSRHGVVANSWWEEVDGEWRNVGSVHDTAEAIVGLAEVTGRSPRNLLAPGLGDWIAQNDPDAQVVTISAKPTAAVLMTGQVRGHVYWYDYRAGHFVTSTYYADAYPDWAERFNTRVLPEFYADSIWECDVPPALRGLARRDAADYENWGEHTTFPHRFLEEVDDPRDPSQFYSWWDNTPLLDLATLAFATEAVSSLSLGQRGSVDFLALSLSQLDRVGHRFGPISLEQLDAILRLDRALGEFFEFLDRTVGRDRYVVGVSSDHGVLRIPAYRVELGLPGLHITREDWRAVQRRVAEAAATAGSAIEQQAAVAGALEEFDFVADVMTLEELVDGEPADSFVALYRRSYYPGRLAGGLPRYGLVVRTIEGAHGDSDMTTHGSPYHYDRHVPLIFLGPGIVPGSSEEAARTVDMAPTLAELAGVPYPDELDGRPLEVR
jgi:predicted AlkP superfamily pyrophosphatase or phosphodiesterase